VYVGVVDDPPLLAYLPGDAHPGSCPSWSCYNL
jgi:hypothetical protein